MDKNMTKEQKDMIRQLRLECLDLYIRMGLPKEKIEKIIKLWKKDWLV